MIKPLSKLGTEGNHLSLIKNLCKTHSCTILNGEKPVLYSSCQEQGEESTPANLTRRVLDILASAIKQEKEIKRIEVGREEIVLIYR